MDREAIRAACLALPGATESVQWEDDIVFKVGGKIFAVMGATAEQGVSFKCGPETFYELQERSGVRPAPYLARAQWVLVDGDRAIPWPELKTLLERAYALLRQKLPQKAQTAATKKAKTKREPPDATKKTKSASASASAAKKKAPQAKKSATRTTKKAKSATKKAKSATKKAKSATSARSRATARR